MIQKSFYKDIHYVWCSEYFDSLSVEKYCPHAMTAPSSNPADIYRDLKNAVERLDQHNPKISAQRASIKALAVAHNLDGIISDEIKDEIIFMVENAPFKLWRPLIYVIPRAPVESRLVAVPIAKKASFGPEYIINDLNGNEFDIMEL